MEKKNISFSPPDISELEIKEVKEYLRDKGVSVRLQEETMPAINGDWLEALKGEFGKEYYKKFGRPKVCFMGDFNTQPDNPIQRLSIMTFLLLQRQTTARTLQHLIGNCENMYDELTKIDIKKMQDELDYRITVLRPKILEEVKFTRSFGDLSENAEYHADKNSC